LIAQAKEETFFEAHSIFIPSRRPIFLATFNDAQFAFIKNDEGEVTGVIHHLEWLPDIVGKKLKNE